MGDSGNLAGLKPTSSELRLRAEKYTSFPISTLAEVDNILKEFNLNSMKIEKDVQPGWYVAEQEYRGQKLFGLGKSPAEAAQRVLEKIKWLYPEDKVKDEDFKAPEWNNDNYPPHGSEKQFNEKHGL